MVSNVSPLAWNTPIVDEKGNPTPYFNRQLEILLAEKATTDTLAADAVPNTRQVIAGTGLTGGGTLTADVTLLADPEFIRDVIGTALIGGAGITITVDDLGDTITIATTGSGVGGAAYEGGSPTVPTVASLTQLNFGTSSASDGTGGIVFSPQVGTVTPRYLLKAAPSGSFDVYLRFETITSSTSSVDTPLQHSTGIVLRNSANNEVVSWEQSWKRLGTAPYNVWWAAAFRANGANSGTYGTTYLAQRYDAGNAPWLRLHWDGTTVTFYKSTDGKNWLQIGSANVLANLGTPDQIGIVARAETANTAAAAIVSYFDTVAP